MPVKAGSTEPGADQLVRDGLVTLLCRVSSLAAALGLSVATARYLGPQGRGIFAMPTVDAAIATSSFAGLTTAVSFLLLNVRAGRGAIRAVLVAAFPFIVAGSLLVLVLGTLGRHGWATAFALASLPFAALVSIAQGVCYGTRRVPLATYIGMGPTMLSLVGTIAGFYFFGHQPYVAIDAWLISQAVIAVAGCIVIARIGRELPPGAASTPKALGFAAKTGVVNLLTLLNYRADVYVVALFTSPSMLGMYTLAVAGAEATQTATQAVAITTAPHIGSLPAELARAFTARATRNNLAIATCACATIAIVAPPVIEALFGAGFRAIVGPLRILLAGIVAMSANGILANYFTLALGKPEQSLGIAGTGAAISISLSLLLVPRLGLTGAALAVSTSYICSAAINLAMFTRATGIPLRDVVIVRRADLHVYGDLRTRALAYIRRFVALSEGRL